MIVGSHANFLISHRSALQVEPGHSRTGYSSLPPGPALLLVPGFALGQRSTAPRMISDWHMGEIRRRQRLFATRK
jgi:hypothetical protein